MNIGPAGTFRLLNTTYIYRLLHQKDEEHAKELEALKKKHEEEIQQVNSSTEYHSVTKILGHVGKGPSTRYECLWEDGSRSWTAPFQGPSMRELVKEYAKERDRLRKQAKKAEKYLLSTGDEDEGNESDISNGWTSRKRGIRYDPDYEPSTSRATNRESRTRSGTCKKNRTN